MQIKKVLIIYHMHISPALEKLKKALDKLQVRYKTAERSKATKRMMDVDLIITIGGDGTFLRTCHMISSDALVLSVNADPEKNVGFYSRADSNDIEKRIKNIISNKYKAVLLPRLQVSINNDKCKTLALNEVYFGDPQPYGTIRYLLQVSKIKEYQMSSGIIVATPYGSHGWAYSIGIKPLTKTSKFLKLIVREPVVNRLWKPNIVRANIHQREKVILHPHRGKAIIGIDGIKSYYADEKSKVEIRLAKETINFIEQC